MSIVSHENEFEAVLSYMARFEKFKDSKSWFIGEDVWKRPTRPQSFKYTKFEEVNRGNLLNYSTFTMNRILTALYELDFLFLPESSKDIITSINDNYSDDLLSYKANVLSLIEDKMFGFIENEVTVDGEWDRESFDEYFMFKSEQINNKPKSLEFIEKSKNKVILSKFLIMQHALDFLPESSHMVRYAKGDYGSEQSALFRVLLDEFGYGRHDEKHSTLFKKTLNSIGMLDNSHAYWNFYLNSTLLNNNYFHLITTKPTRFFEYIGAITWAENSFGPYCRMVSDTLKICFEDIDTRYYQEHDHIDGYHGTMTLNEILHPLAKRFGNQVYKEFVKGIEISCILQEIMESDLLEQLSWMEERDKYIEIAKRIKSNVLADIDNLPVASLNEPEGELSVPHNHDGDEFCIVDEGVLRFCHGPDWFTDLKAGDCVVIKKNRIHGALVLSDYCKYRILSIGDFEKYENYKD